MGRTFRRANKKQKKQFKNFRKERNNKRTVKVGEYGTGKSEDKRRQQDNEWS